MKTLLQVTLNTLKKHDACQDGYVRLSKSLGGDEIYGLDTPINVLTILKYNGLDDALWSLRATIQNSNKVSNLFSADCAESVLHIFEEKYPYVMQPRNAIQATRDFANDLISSVELDDAVRAVWDAGGVYSMSARDAIASGFAGNGATGVAKVARASVDNCPEEMDKQIQFLKKYLME